MSIKLVFYYLAVLSLVSAGLIMGVKAPKN